MSAFAQWATDPPCRKVHNACIFSPFLPPSSGGNLLPSSTRELDIIGVRPVLDPSFAYGAAPARFDDREEERRTGPGGTSLAGGCALAPSAVPGSDARCDARAFRARSRAAFPPGFMLTARTMSL